MHMQFSGTQCSASGFSQRGISMLEVLVSVVVLSVGALGVAGMQVSSLKDTGSASSRHQAASLAYGMLDVLRANRTEAIKGGADYVSALASGACTGNDVAPVKQWQNYVACALPNSQGGVAIDTFTMRAVVTVQWDDSRGKRGDAAQQFQIETRL